MPNVIDQTVKPKNSKKSNMVDGVKNSGIYQTLGQNTDSLIRAKSSERELKLRNRLDELKANYSNLLQNEKEIADQEIISITAELNRRDVANNFSTTSRLNSVGSLENWSGNARPDENPLSKWALSLPKNALRWTKSYAERFEPEQKTAQGVNVAAQELDKLAFRNLKPSKEDSKIEKGLVGFKRDVLNYFDFALEDFSNIEDGFVKVVSNKSDVIGTLNQQLGRGDNQEGKLDSRIKGNKTAERRKEKSNARIKYLMSACGKDLAMLDSSSKNDSLLGKVWNKVKKYWSDADPSAFAKNLLAVKEENPEAYEKFISTFCEKQWGYISGMADEMPEVVANTRKTLEKYVDQKTGRSVFEGRKYGGEALLGLIPGLNNASINMTAGALTALAAMTATPALATAAVAVGTFGASKLILEVLGAKIASVSTQERRMGGNLDADTVNRMLAVNVSNEGVAKTTQILRTIGLQGTAQFLGKVVQSVGLGNGVGAKVANFWTEETGLSANLISSDDLGKLITKSYSPVTDKEGEKVQKTNIEDSEMAKKQSEAARAEVLDVAGNSLLLLSTFAQIAGTSIAGGLIGGAVAEITNHFKNGGTVENLSFGKITEGSRQGAVIAGVKSTESFAGSLSLNQGSKLDDQLFGGSVQQWWKQATWQPAVKTLIAPGIELTTSHFKQKNVPAGKTLIHKNGYSFLVDKGMEANANNLSSDAILKGLSAGATQIDSKNLGLQITTDPKSGLKYLSGDAIETTKANIEGTANDYIFRINGQRVSAVGESAHRIFDRATGKTYLVSGSNVGAGNRPVMALVEMNEALSGTVKINEDLAQGLVKYDVDGDSGPLTAGGQGTSLQEESKSVGSSRPASNTSETVETQTERSSSRSASWGEGNNGADEGRTKGRPAERVAYNNSDISEKTPTSRVIPKVEVNSETSSRKPGFNAKAIIEETRAKMKAEIKNDVPEPKTVKIQDKPQTTSKPETSSVTQIDSISSKQSTPDTTPKTEVAQTDNPNNFAQTQTKEQMGERLTQSIIDLKIKQNGKSESVNKLPADAQANAGNNLYIKPLTQAQINEANNYALTVKPENRQAERETALGNAQKTPNQNQKQFWNYLASSLEVKNKASAGTVVAGASLENTQTGNNVSGLDPSLNLQTTQAILKNPQHPRFNDVLNRIRQSDILTDPNPSDVKKSMREAYNKATGVQKSEVLTPNGNPEATGSTVVPTKPFTIPRSFDLPKNGEPLEFDGRDGKPSIVYISKEKLPLLNNINLLKDTVVVIYDPNNQNKAFSVTVPESGKGKLNLNAIILPVTDVVEKKASAGTAVAASTLEKKPGTVVVPTVEVAPTTISVPAAKTPEEVIRITGQPADTRTTFVPTTTLPNPNTNFGKESLNISDSSRIQPTGSSSRFAAIRNDNAPSLFKTNIPLPTSPNLVKPATMPAGLKLTPDAVYVDDKTYYVPLNELNKLNGMGVPKGATLVVYDPKNSNKAVSMPVVGDGNGRFNVKNIRQVLDSATQIQTTAILPNAFVPSSPYTTAQPGTQNLISTLRNYRDGTRTTLGTGGTIDGVGSLERGGSEGEGAFQVDINNPNRVRLAPGITGQIITEGQNLPSIPLSTLRKNSILNIQTQVNIKGVENKTEDFITPRTENLEYKLIEGENNFKIGENNFKIGTDLNGNPVLVDTNGVVYDPTNRIIKSKGDSNITEIPFNEAIKQSLEISVKKENIILPGTPKFRPLDRFVSGINTRNQTTVTTEAIAKVNDIANQFRNDIQRIAPDLDANALIKVLDLTSTSAISTKGKNISMGALEQTFNQAIAKYSPEVQQQLREVRTRTIEGIGNAVLLTYEGNHSFGKGDKSLLDKFGSNNPQVRSLIQIADAYGAVAGHNSGNITRDELIANSGYDRLQTIINNIDSEQKSINQQLKDLEKADWKRSFNSTTFDYNEWLNDVAKQKQDLRSRLQARLKEIEQERLPVELALSKLGFNEQSKLTVDAKHESSGFNFLLFGKYKSKNEITLSDPDAPNLRDINDIPMSEKVNQTGVKLANILLNIGLGALGPGAGGAVLKISHKEGSVGGLGDVIRVERAGQPTIEIKAEKMNNFSNYLGSEEFLAKMVKVQQEGRDPGVEIEKQIRIFYNAELKLNDVPPDVLASAKLAVMGQIFMKGKTSHGNLTIKLDSEQAKVLGLDNSKNITTGSFEQAQEQAQTVKLTNLGINASSLNVEAVNKFNSKQYSATDISNLEKQLSSNGRKVDIEIKSLREIANERGLQIQQTRDKNGNVIEYIAGYNATGTDTQGEYSTSMLPADSVVMVAKVSDSQGNIVGYDVLRSAPVDKNSTQCIANAQGVGEKIRVTAPNGSVFECVNGVCRPVETIPEANIVMNIPKNPRDHQAILKFAQEVGANPELVQKFTENVSVIENRLKTIQDLGKAFLKPNVPANKAIMDDIKVRNPNLYSLLIIRENANLVANGVPSISNANIKLVQNKHTGWGILPLPGFFAGGIDTGKMEASMISAKLVFNGKLINPRTGTLCEKIEIDINQASKESNSFALFGFKLFANKPKPQEPQKPDEPATTQGKQTIPKAKQPTSTAPNQAGGPPVKTSPQPPTTTVNPDGTVVTPTTPVPNTPPVGVNPDTANATILNSGGNTSSIPAVQTGSITPPGANLINGTSVQPQNTLNSFSPANTFPSDVPVPVSGTVTGAFLPSNLTSTASQSVAPIVNANLAGAANNLQTILNTPLGTATNLGTPVIPVLTSPALQSGLGGTATTLTP